MQRVPSPQAEAVNFQGQSHRVASIEALMAAAAPNLKEALYGGSQAKHSRSPRTAPSMRGREPEHSHAAQPVRSSLDSLVELEQIIEEQHQQL
eukprot:gene14169-16755_t